MMIYLEKDKIDFDKPEYYGNICACPSKVPDNIKLYSKCAIFINNPEYNMYDWYEGVIVQIKKNTINKYNVEILFEHIVDEDPFIVECLLEKETYGKDKFWVLI